MTPAAREAVAAADVLVGGKRHLQQFRILPVNSLLWRQYPGTPELD
jgi:precorrin-6B methylase 1